MVDFTSDIPGSKTKIVDRHNVADERSLHNDISSKLCSPFLVMTGYEADHIVQSLKTFPLEEIGSSEFINMYAYQLERLSLQAHASAHMIRSDANLLPEDEFVVESILNFEKVPTLVHTLLSVELWRVNLSHHNNKCRTSKPNNNDNNSNNGGDDMLSDITLLEKDDWPFLSYLASHGNTLRLSFILHTETTLVCLLTLVLFRSASCRDMDVDTVIALVDYCSRQMSLLIAPSSVNDVVRRQKEPLSTQDFVKQMGRSSLDEIRDIILDTNYKTAVAATCLARYLCEHIDYLPLGAQTRILDTHDFLMTFIPLLDEPPWTRRRQVTRQSKNSTTPETIMIWEKFQENNQWMEVPLSQLLHVTKYEAQCWLSIFHLISSNVSRQQYEFNTFRKDQLLRLRKFLNEVTIDQIPILSDVMLFMDQLSIMAVPDSTTGVGSAFLLQEVDKLRESIIQGKTWESIFQHQIQVIFSKVKDLNDPDLRLISTIYDEDSYAAIVEGTFTHTNLFSEPLDIIRLRSYDKTNQVWKEVATFRAQKESSVIDTPAGPFRRSKLQITYLIEQPVKFYLDDKVEAMIYFNATNQFSKVLRSEELAKSTPSQNSIAMLERKKVWCQLGSLDEKIVLQLCLSTQDSELTNGEPGYYIDQAFFSQPTLSE